jgi:hypothetical protein
MRAADNGPYLYPQLEQCERIDTKLVVREPSKFPPRRGNLAPHSNTAAINMLPTFPGDLATPITGSLKRLHDLSHSSISVSSALSQASIFGLRS